MVALPAHGSTGGDAETALIDNGEQQTTIHYLTATEPFKNTLAPINGRDAEMTVVFAGPRLEVFRFTLHIAEMPSIPSHRTNAPLPFSPKLIYSFLSRL